MKTWPVVVAMCGVFAGFVQAQNTPNDLEMEVRVSGHRVLANGPERRAAALNTRSVTPEKTTAGTIGIQRCGALAVATARGVAHADTRGGWSVEVTPLRTVNHAVTFRLKWSRMARNGSIATGDDLELTLKPGESRPLDSVRVTPDASDSGCGMGVQGATLRVSVDRPEFFDRRQLGVHIWLVERLPDGREQSQVQHLRGQPFKSIPFYFNSRNGGGERFDIHGHLVADVEHRGLDIALETVRAKAIPDQIGYQAARWLRANQRLSPNEIVEIALKDDFEDDWPSQRKLALRVRVVPLR